RQAHRLRRDPRGMRDAAAAGARRICHRRHRDDDPAAPALGRRARFPRRRLRHPLARTLPRAAVVIPLTPEILLQAYAAGIFPMAESADDPDLFWVDPTRRGIIPLDAFHVPRRLKRVLRRGVFEVRADSDFAGVMRGCAEAG